MGCNLLLLYDLFILGGRGVRKFHRGEHESAEFSQRLNRKDAMTQRFAMILRVLSDLSGTYFERSEKSCISFFPSNSMSFRMK